MKRVVIVGLGNPGKEYEYTRHNLGYLAVQELGSEWRLRFKKEPQFESMVAEATFEEKNFEEKNFEEKNFEILKVNLVLPLTYMNDSGRAVQKILNFYNISVKELIVAVDDMALPFGQMRVRDKGSSGGHNGLKSIESALGTRHYVRLRLGISEKMAEMEAIDHVLGEFSREEKKMLPEYVLHAAHVLKRLLQEDFYKVQGDVNRKKGEHE